MSRQRFISQEEELERWQALEEVREAFPYTIEGFLLFAQTCINLLIKGNPDLNEIQADICKYLFSGPLYRMIQAQRGQAKTTLTAIFAVFVLIHKPKHRILIVSAAGKLSKEIASFVIQILNSIEFLWMLRADENAGDRASVEAYDIHWYFKGVDKSPSVKCLGVDSSIQGSRADLLIADDIESTKNSRTIITREVLEDLTKEFESVCSEGDIIYLGTPQSAESIYNNLPSRGYSVRIWTGRYPTEKQIKHYGDCLAPIILKKIAQHPELQTGGGIDGQQGQPTCPEMFDEEKLLKKEISLGPAKFQLQYMLLTKLMDEERYPLKAGKLVVIDFNLEQGPVMPIASSDIRNRFIHSAAQRHQLHWAVSHTYEYLPFEQTIMAIDGAGGGRNGDETGYAVIKTIGAFIYLYKVGGVAGGYEPHKLQKLVEIAKESKANLVIIEQNYGYGAHAAVLKPLFNKLYPVTIEEEYVTGQKELRIIDTLEPIISTNRLIIHPQLIIDDWESTVCYPTEKRSIYTFLHQLAMLTRDKGCLPHDDRVEAVAGACRKVIGSLEVDTNTILAQRKLAEHLEFINNWSDPVTRRQWLSGVAPTNNRNVIGGQKRSRNNVI